MIINKLKDTFVDEIHDVYIGIQHELSQHFMLTH